MCQPRAVTALPSPIDTSEASQDDKDSSVSNTQSNRGAGPASDGYSDTATLLKQLNELTAVILARDKALQANASSKRTGKRKVECLMTADALTGTGYSEERTKL